MENFVQVFKISFDYADDVDLFVSQKLNNSLCWEKTTEGLTWSSKEFDMVFAAVTML